MLALFSNNLTGSDSNGLYLSSCSDNSIISCNISNNLREGVGLLNSIGTLLQDCLISNNSNEGLYLGDGNHGSLIKNSTFTLNGWSVWKPALQVFNCNNITILDNLFYNNHGDAIIIFNGKYCVIEDNEVNKNRFGTVSLHNCSHSVISRNQLFNNSWYTESYDIIAGITVTPNSLDRQFSNNTISFNTLTNNGYTDGIFIGKSDNNKICYNDVFFNYFDHAILGLLGNGITLSNSSNNNIYGNNINHNQEYGIFLETNSSYNTVVFNTFINNTKANVNITANGIGNSWDNGVFGNYWDDHPGGASDGYIWETSYPIPTSPANDNFPLVNPFTINPSMLLDNVNIQNNCPVEISNGSQLNFSVYTSNLPFILSNITLNCTTGTNYTFLMTDFTRISNQRYEFTLPSLNWSHGNVTIFVANVTEESGMSWDCSASSIRVMVDIFLIPASPSMVYIGTNPTSDQEIHLIWNIIPDTDGYLLYRSTSEITSIAGMIPIVNSTDNQQHAHVDNVDGEGDYYYVIISYNSKKNSTLSNLVRVAVDIDDGQPSSEIPGFPGIYLFISIFFSVVVIAIKYKKRYN